MDAPFQMPGHARTELDPICPEQRVVRGVDVEGNLPAFGKETRLDGPVNQLVGDDRLVLSPAVVAGKQRLSVFVGARQPHDRALPVQIHLYLRIDGQVDGRMGLHEVLIIPKAEHQQEAGRDGDQAAGGPLRGAAWLFLLLHQDGMVHRLTDFIAEIGGLTEPPLLVKQNRISGVAFQNQIAHCAVPPFIVCWI